MVTQLLIIAKLLLLLLIIAPLGKCYRVWLHCVKFIILLRPMGDFENLKSEGKLVLNTCNNNDQSSSGDYPESVVLESSANPGLVWQMIQEPLTQYNYN